MSRDISCDEPGPLRRRTGVDAIVAQWPGRAERRRPFTDVVGDHLDAVHRYVVMLTGDALLAEDVTAQSFEKALRSWRRFDPRRGTELAWLCGIARRTALDHFRSEARRRRRETVYENGRVPEADAALGGFSPELDAALGSLSAGEREVLALRIVLELDAETAARLLGISRTACSMRLARALQKLQQRMATHALA
jgi:RNA polymerase sigma factor (sigma-70 family)